MLAAGCLEIAFIVIITMCAVNMYVLFGLQ